MKFIKLIFISLVFCQSFSAQEKFSLLVQDYRRESSLNVYYNILRFFEDYLDSHTFLGIGFYNFKSIKDTDSSDFDVFWVCSLGLGYPLNDSLSFGFETGYLFSQKDFNKIYKTEENVRYSNHSHSIRNSWLVQKKYNRESKVISRSYTKMDIPLRFYTKFSMLSFHNVQWLSLILFSGLDMTFLNSTIVFSHQSYTSYLKSINVYDENFFIHHFSLGLRARIAFLGIEYLYQIPLGSCFQEQSIIGQRHCISFGLYF